jgi:probable rRNA maturation factor
MRSLLFAFSVSLRGSLIVVEPPSTGDFPALDRAGLSRFVNRARKAAALDGDVTVLLADDGRLKELNRTYRRKNKPTDVLSFPAGENGEGVAGDLAISVETAARQAAEHGHALDDELRILVLHGVLHLAGYDHEADTGEMRTLESALRAKLKLPVGLIERTQPAVTKKSGRVLHEAHPSASRMNGAPSSSSASRNPAKTLAKKAAKGVAR